MGDTTQLYFSPHPLRQFIDKSPSDCLQKPRDLRKIACCSRLGVGIKLICGATEVLQEEHNPFVPRKHQDQHAKVPKAITNFCNLCHICNCSQTFWDMRWSSVKGLLGTLIWSLSEPTLYWSLFFWSLHQNSIFFSKIKLLMVLSGRITVGRHGIRLTLNTNICRVRGFFLTGTS